MLHFLANSKLVGWLIKIPKILLARLISVLFFFLSDPRKDRTNGVLGLRMLTSMMIVSDSMKEKDFSKLVDKLSFLFFLKYLQYGLLQHSGFS